MDGARAPSPGAYGAELMAAIDEVPEHVGGGRGVAVGGDLAEADVVEDEQLLAGPATQAGLVEAVGEAGVELGEEVGEAGDADDAAGQAGTQRDGAEDRHCAGSPYPRDLGSRSERGLGGGLTMGLAASRCRRMVAVWTMAGSMELWPRLRRPQQARHRGPRTPATPAARPSTRSATTTTSRARGEESQASPLPRQRESRACPSPADAPVWCARHHAVVAVTGPAGPQ